MHPHQTLAYLHRVRPKCLERVVSAIPLQHASVRVAVHSRSRKILSDLVRPVRQRSSSSPTTKPESNSRLHPNFQHQTQTPGKAGLAYVWMTLLVAILSKNRLQIFVSSVLGILLREPVHLLLVRLHLLVERLLREPSVQQRRLSHTRPAADVSSLITARVTQLFKHSSSPSHLSKQCPT